MSSWWPVIPGIGALITYWLFVIFYAGRSAWWSNPTGWSLLLSKFALVMILTHVVVVLSVGDYPGRINMWGIIAVLLWAAGIAQFVNLLRLQRKDREDNHPRRRSTDHY